MESPVAMKPNSDKHSIAGQEAAGSPRVRSIEDGLKVLDLIQQALDSENVPYWLDAGGCLKAYRDGQFIESTDLDFGMWRDHIRRILKAVERLREKGFSARFQGGMPYVDDHVVLLPPREFSTPFANIDFVMYRRLGDEACKISTDHPEYSQPLSRTVRSILTKIRRSKFRSRTLRAKIGNALPFSLRAHAWKWIFYTYLYVYKTVWFVVPAQYFDALVQIDVHGTKVLIPKDTEGYLAYRYGANWRTPTKKWRLTDGFLIRIRSARSLANEFRRPIFIESDDIVWDRPVIRRGSFEFTPEERRRAAEAEERLQASPARQGSESRLTGR
jgi:glycosyltransferase involved in cell wall biosynthesis